MVYDSIFVDQCRTIEFYYPRICPGENDEADLLLSFKVHRGKLGC